MSFKGREVRSGEGTGRLLGLLAVALVALFYCSATVLADEKPKIKIGVLLSLSGGLEQWCSYMRQGVDLAASEHESAGVKILVEDDHSVEKRATLGAARRLLDVESVDALYTWTPSNVAILTPLAKKDRVPLIAGAYNEQVAKAGDYVFGAVVNNLLTPREIAQYFKARGAGRVGLVLAADDWSTSFEQPFRAEAGLLGLNVAYSATISPSETETRAIVTNLEQRHVDAVLAPLYGNALLSFIRRHREMKAESLINVGDGMFESDITALGGAAEGVTAMQVWLESPQLSEKVRKRFGETYDPLQLGLVASGYDLMAHLIRAAAELRKEGLPVTGENLNQLLKSFASNGYLGEHMLGAAPPRSGEPITVVEGGRYRLASKPASPVR
jgi:ABC-type branched-subunit amino acid transport system substrate-binding protein